MARTRDNYQVSGRTIEDLARSLNFILQRLADRIDRIEGIRGTASIESNLDMNQNVITEVATPSAQQDATRLEDLAALLEVPPLSVLGQSANETGPVTTIAASANDRVLRRVSDTLDFGLLTNGMFDTNSIPDAALSSNIPRLNAAANAFTGAELSLTNATNPKIVVSDSDAGSDGKRWAMRNGNGSLTIVAETDAGVPTTNLLLATRSGTTIASATIAATSISLSGQCGFQGTSPIAKPTVTGSRGANAALASLLTALANYGLITDSSS